MCDLCVVFWRISEFVVCVTRVVVFVYRWFLTFDSFGICVCWIDRCVCVGLIGVLVNCCVMFGVLKPKSIGNG